MHWWDAKRRVWRGVAPRLQAKSLLVPRGLFAYGSTLRVRVCATSGIATGCSEGPAGFGDNYKTPDLTVTLGGVGTPNQNGTRPIPCVLPVIVTDSAGGALPYDNITWYDSRKSQLARGKFLDLRNLPTGPQVIRVVVRGTGGQLAAKSWLIQRTAAGCTLISTICDPPARHNPDKHPHPHPVPPPCEA